MESMTGYSFIEKSTDQFSFSIEIKSLNSRYLETTINLPRYFRNEEKNINDIMKKSFNRGKIILSIEIFNWRDKKPVVLNSDLIKIYYKELNRIHKTLKIKEPLKFESALSLDGITSRESTVLSEKSVKVIYDYLDNAVKKAIKMRIREGSAIKTDVSKIITEISSKINKIKSISKSAVNTKIIKLKERIEKLSGNDLDDTRLHSEIVILADKLDINEEIVRANDHIQKFRSILKEKKQIGRKLDFIAQEIFREINTISSKSNNSEISHNVVDIKNCIEKIREHCRNVV